MNKVHELAHEIRTPLAALNSNLDLLDKAFRRLLEMLKADESPEKRELVTVIEESLRINRLACDRMEALVRSLRGESKTTNLNDIIESALSLLSHELKGRIQVTKDFAASPLIESRGDQLQQVFMNLLLNAAQAIQGSGEIRITTRLKDAIVRAEVSDNGPGIPVEIRDKIFQRGFTTKSATSGMGLGLWICRKIVEDHGGRIELDGTPGQGTTFKLEFPAAGGKERKADE